MVNYIYGGFTGTVEKLVSRFKLKKPATDVRKEEHNDKDVEMNVEIHQGQNNSIYKTPGVDNNQIG
jgi:hypothetical protein